MRVIVAGPDEHDIAAAIEAEGHEVCRVDVANRPALEDAGIVDAGAYVLTEVRQATSIPVAVDLNDALKVVVYDTESLPDFARGQADLVVDPHLLDPAAVAAEL
jgi:hypothetical protein